MVKFPDKLTGAVMTSKERVMTALKHKEPDRVPIDFWVIPLIAERLREKLGFLNVEQLLKYFNVDLRVIKGPVFKGRELKKYPDGKAEDLWGVLRRQVTVKGAKLEQVYMEVDKSSFAGMETSKEIEAYDKWPSADW